MKPDFEKAAKEYADNPMNVSYFMTANARNGFVAGCEHAYSIDKETIERLEKENKELKQELAFQKYQVNFLLDNRD